MYKWDAEDYHKSSCEQQKWARELILKLELKGNERALDIGCGDGKVTAELAKRLPSGSVFGIDNSEELIRFAQGNFPSENFPNLAFELIDPEKWVSMLNSMLFFQTLVFTGLSTTYPFLKELRKA